jgi:dienelactone hydrolase
VIVRPGRDDALVDTEDGVVVEGVPAGRQVEVESRVELAGLSWTCRGVYAAGPGGTIDTARDPSLGGDYEGIDPWGLLWSADAGGRMDLGRLDPMRVEVTASAPGGAAHAAYERRWVTAGVDVRAVDEDGVVGRVHLPPGDELPGLVLVGGSDGGLGGPAHAPLLANHGAAALSIAYWGYPGVPDALHDIDVEVVGRACDWLRKQPGVRDERPTVLGISRGGELALLSGTLMPDRVGSVVSVVGSPLPWGAFGTGDDNDTSWRFDGEPVPAMWEDPDDFDLWRKQPEQVAAVEIAVERVDGQVLLLTGVSDAMWDATDLSQIAVRRAERLGVADRVTHVAYPDAGHACCAPPGYAIQDGTSLHPFDGKPFTFGGTRAGNQAARRDSWRRLRDLLGV